MEPLVRRELLAQVVQALPRDRREEFEDLSMFDVAQRRVRVSYRRLEDGVRYDVRRRASPPPSMLP